MWRDQITGSLYDGDMRTGDREATAQEVADWLAQRNGPISQIADLLSLAGVSQDWHLDGLMAGMVALAATQGITESQLYAVNPGYREVKDVSEQIKALRTQL